MKKTLITLLAVASCASALELTTQDLTGYAVATEGWSSVNDWSLGSLTATENDNGSVLLSGDIATSPSYLVNSETNEYKNYTTTTVAITLDLSKLTLPAAGESNAVTRSNFVTLDGTTDIGMAISSEGKVSVIWGTNLNYFTVNSVLGNTGNITLTFSCNNEGTTLHVGSTKDTHSNLKGDVGVISGITLSAAAVNALQCISVYSGTASLRDDDLAASAASINASIPEPATATLSLLALVGLAARRRRK